MLPKADDEALHELQNELESERRGGEVLSLTKEEWRALVSWAPQRTFEERGSLHVPARLPELEAIEQPHLFSLSRQDRALLVVQQLHKQAQQRYQDLQWAAEELATACALAHV